MNPETSCTTIDAIYLIMVVIILMANGYILFESCLRCRRINNLQKELLEKIKQNPEKEE